VQLQVHARSQQRLDLLARSRPDLLQLGPALADQYRLLPFTFAVNSRRNPRQRQLRRRSLFARLDFGPWLFKALDHYGRSVRNLLARLHKDPLANQLRHHEALRLIGVLVLGEVPLTCWQRLDNLPQQQVKPVLLARAHRDHLGEVVPLDERVDHGQQLVLRNKVDLRHHQEHRAIELPHQSKQKLILARPDALSVGEPFLRSLIAIALGCPRSRF
jgi:hypothetical protein